MSLNHDYPTQILIRQRHQELLAEAAAERLAKLARGDRATWWSRLAGRMHLNPRRRSQARPEQVARVPDVGRCLARP